MTLKVALVYNQPEADRYGSMGESAAELGVLEEVKAVIQALAELNCECLPVPLKPPLSNARKILKKIKADVVFNLFEGFDSSPETENKIASTLIVAFSCTLVCLIIFHSVSPHRCIAGNRQKN